MDSVKLGVEGQASVKAIDKLDVLSPKEDDNSSLSSEPVPSPDVISIIRESIFIFCICLSQMLTQASVAQTISSSSKIGKTFGVENIAGELSWFSASFSLTVGTFILISGRLGDMYGYKTMYLIGYIWYGVCSLATGFSGFSTSSVLFDIMRSLQGIGPAIIMPNSLALIGSYYPPGLRKDICMCLFGAVAPSGFVFGALFGGMFAQLVWWPWSFWINGIFCFIASIIAFFAIPKNIGNHKLENRGKFDWYGSISGVCGLILINFAINQGPNVGWEKRYVYILLIVGFLCMIAFMYIEGKVEDPLVPPAVLKGETGFILACIAAGWSCFGVWLYYSFRWSQIVDQDSIVLSGVKFIPIIVLGFIAAFSSGFLLQRIPSSAVLLMAMLFFLIGIVLMGTRPVGQVYWTQKFISIILKPLGMDMSFPAGCILISMAVPSSQQGIAASLVTTFVNYSISIGLGLAGTVEYYVTKDKPQILATQIHGIRCAFYLGMALAGFGVILSGIFFLVQLSNRSKSVRSSEN